jgi:hypothetical protein
MNDQQILDYWKAHIKDKLWVSRLLRIMAEELPATHKRTIKKFPQVTQLLKELNHDR